MKNVKCIKNAQIVLENGIIWDGSLIIENDKIVNYGSSRDTIIPACAEVIDAKGAYVGPGFVDIHVHNGIGFSTSYDTVKASKYFLKHGETTILATPSYGMNFDELMKALRSIKEAMDSGEAKSVKGIYSEGPYTNPKYGSHADLNPWRHGIKEEEYKALVDEAGKYITVWTIAPELDGIQEFAEYARKVNPDVIFALGHSEATPKQIRAMGNNLPKILTHAMCATGRQKAFVLGFGPDEYCYKEPDMYAELISDSFGIHVHPEMQQLLLHTKGLDKVILITDCTYYENPVPEKYNGVTDLNFDHQGHIAGSKLTMDMACRNIMTHTNCGIAQAFKMASTNPAKALGLDEKIGSIAVGKTADLVFVDDRFNVKNVMLGGEIQAF